MPGRVLAAGLAMAALVLAVPALSQTINTVAGGGAGDGGDATIANLNSPASVAVDSSGNLYIADLGNERIRKIAAATGIISTVAGNGVLGFAGDGGAATNASLNSPASVAQDASGNLYIAEYANHRIRKVTAATGIITTVAGNGINSFAGDGGAATSASLSHPNGVALDAGGNLYIADLGNERIRKVAAATGIITTVAGNGVFGFAGDGGAATNASLGVPVGVAVDAGGNLYIADYSNHRIRKVSAATGIITTVAGNGINTFAGDGGAATSASLNSPSGVALDASGNLYIADYFNNRIRKVDAASGIITTVAGNGSFGFAGDGGAATSASVSGPAGVAVDAGGNLYIANYSTHRIRKVDAATGIITTVAGNGNPSFAGDGGAATSASVYVPTGVALDASGNLYIADYGNQRIRKVDAASGIISTVAGNGSPAFAGDDGAATSASLNGPVAVALDASGNLYVADQGNHRIRKVAAATGIITTVAGNGINTFAGDGGAATNASLNYPASVALDASGNLYIADPNNNRIRKVAAATGIITTVAGGGSALGDGGAATSASLYGPTAVALDASGNLYIADQNNHRVRKVDAATGIITTVAGNGSPAFAGDGGAATSASLNNPDGVAVDASGNVYVADQSNHRIRRVAAATGIITTVAGNGINTFAGDGGAATSASLNNPDRIALDASGNLYIADQRNNRIRKVTFHALRADFDGDGRSDVLWRNSATGENYCYFMNGTAVRTQGFLRTVEDPNWTVAGISDFDGDGRADILWRNLSTGENYLWLMNGLSTASEGSVNFVDPASGWQVQGVGDFDGDGKADILWRNTSTGENYIYLMNGLTIASPGSINSVSDQAWQVQGIGDFDGDGKADILWRNISTGENYIWLMNGLSTVSQGSVNFVDPASGWQVQGIGDFDGDGKADILWRNSSTGENYIYLMNGLTIARPGSINSVSDQAWQVNGIGDFDGDGKADILWRNSSTGENYIWRMNGLSTASQGSVNFVDPASGWQVQR